VARILVVDDEPLFLRLMANILTKNGGHEVQTATGGDRAQEILNRHHFDIVVTDYLMSPVDGMQLLKFVVAMFPSVPVIIISGYGSLDTKAQALRAGAFDYLQKPVGVEDLLKCIQQAMNDIKARISAGGTPSLPRIPQPQAAANIVGASPAIQEVLRVVRQVAPSDAGILVVGEPGVGKKLIARTLYQFSGRQQAPLAHIPCRSLTLTHTYHALFGHDASDDSGTGRFLQGNLAAGGTVLLEDVNALPAEVQDAFLLALQMQQFQQRPDGPSFRIDTRILATSTVPLDNTGFNRELLRWVGTVTLRIPPLRERPEDIDVLCGMYQKQMAETLGWRTITPEAMKLLKAYAWPSNVLELKRALRAAWANARDGRITPETLPREISRLRPPAAAQADVEDAPTHDPSKRAVLDALMKRHGSA
jgi:DNA-binding NtrC family response regulator